jgi:lipopolysaccharide transport system permease protein
MYRDFKIIVPFFLQFGMFLAPVGFGTYLIPENFQYIYFLNPMVGIIDGFRWSLYGISYPLLSLSITYSCVISVALLVSGFFYFRRMERTFADRL